MRISLPNLSNIFHILAYQPKLIIDGMGKIEKVIKEVDTEGHTEQALA